MAGRIAERRRDIPATRAMLVAVSGIDASGKGFVAQGLSVALEPLRVAIIALTTGSTCLRYVSRIRIARRIFTAARLDLTKCSSS
jgi:polyphosphate kinase 2 (PPK2 family)